jgi:hypothetical protein
MSRNCENALDRFLTIYIDETRAAGAKDHDVFHRDGLLLARTVIPALHANVRPRDKITGGIAMRADNTIVNFYPFTLRQVCRNGAVMARSSRCVSFSLDEMIHDPVTDDELREAIRCCTTRDSFMENITAMQKATTHRFDQVLNVLPLLAMMSPRVGKSFANAILEQFQQEERTAYGLMNAVTAVARKTRDPETKWRLEELGGSIPVLLRAPRSPRTDGVRCKTRERELVMA